MVPTPIAIGLWVCDQVIIDRGSMKPSLIGVFSGLAVDTFPTEPQRFSVFSSLTDGSGSGRIMLAVTSDRSDEVVYSQSGEITFPNRLTVVNASFRLRRITFPHSGTYTFDLSVDQQLVAQCRLRVYISELD